MREDGRQGGARGDRRGGWMAGWPCREGDRMAVYRGGRLGLGYARLDWAGLVYTAGLDGL